MNTTGTNMKKNEVEVQSQAVAFAGIIRSNEKYPKSSCSTKTELPSD